MITYTVWYRKSFFWKTLKKVKGDDLYQSGPMIQPVRVFILEDETRREIPNTYEFKFSKERFFSIKERMETEAGIDIKLNKK